VQLAQIDRRAMLQRWIAPPTDAEAGRLQRAERMVRGAVSRHASFTGVDYTVEAKGSFANNTNVRYDSDVDIKVQVNEPYYHDYHPKLNFLSWRLKTKSSGLWTPDYLREQVGLALQAAFGNINKSHNVAFYVPEVAGSRPSTDVVPCFAYHQYRDWNCTQRDEGSLVYTRDGSKIINWPHQQLVNGRAKNVRTNRRYKFAVRALKAVENDLAEAGIIGALPSYFMECLVYNVPDQVLLVDSLDAAFHGALSHLREAVDWWFGNPRKLVEPNEIKKVFQDGQKWKVQDARQLLEAAWHYLSYG
jgi:hypothetical protein